MQHAQEATTKAESQAFAAFRQITKAGVIEPKLAQSLAQRFEVVVVDGIQAAENHRLRFLVAGQSDLGRAEGIRHGVANMDIAQRFDLGHQVADLTRA